ncbi:MAG TPA: DUF2252 family protein [Magnetospirillaceae bacterium]|jgi:hypothetical protein
MNVVEATKAYESWMAARIPVIRRDLDLKHKQMASAPFPFLRATFYRWSQIWGEACPDLDAAPSLLAVGDLHVENFGTWRDAEGRLVWGINDFDEAARLPYTLDLVRLATSAVLARDAGSLTITPVEACAAILQGYQAAMQGGGKPFVLEEEHQMLRGLALSAERDPVRFWQKMDRGTPVKPPPHKLRALILDSLPRDSGKARIVHRIAGLGSLGRQRYVALAEADGGRVAREAKQLLPTAYRWARGKSEGRIRYEEIVTRAVRCRDPFVYATKGWLLRRLGPHCSRIELADIPKLREERHLLECMGRETANIHLGAADAVAAIKADLRQRKANWLHAAAETMAEATMRDWRVWRRGR